MKEYKNRLREGYWVIVVRRILWARISALNLYVTVNHYCKSIGS